MPSAPAHDDRWVRLDHDPTLDRYTNVRPWAQERVKLEVASGINDYINASLVDLTIPNDPQNETADRYICMQGPKQETVNHVWHMIWHSTSHQSPGDPAVIIMLTPTYAASDMFPGRMVEKCYQYFPSSAAAPLTINESGELGDDFKASVHFVSREDLPGTDIEVRKLEMRVDGAAEVKSILHFLYPTWPDFGTVAAENTESLLVLMDESRTRNMQALNPRIVHCSAGIGRTGTFIALEQLRAQLDSGLWEHWNEGLDTKDCDPVYDMVDKLRTMRQTMVQACEQYIFLYTVLRMLWEKKYFLAAGKADKDGQSNIVVSGQSDRNLGEPPTKIPKT